MSAPLEHSVQAQAEFSSETFGPGARTAGVTDHIRKELMEIVGSPQDERLEEWIDVIILAVDGAWRHAHYDLGVPREELDRHLSEVLRAKMQKNMAREWPDWRTQPRDRAIEHVRSA